MYANTQIATKKEGFSATVSPHIKSTKPPAWLIISTGALALTCLVLAVAETSLWAHYLIDGGEFMSLLGLGFILLAGIHLFRRRQLFVSLPLIFPWLLYPVITQGDQIIDNLSINWMRIICQALLAAIFGTPVAVVVLAVRHLVTSPEGRSALEGRWATWLPGLKFFATGRTREGIGLLVATLLACEIWIAHEFLGTLMVLTLISMVLAALVYASLGAAPRIETNPFASGGERFALAVLLAGVAVSLALYLGYKNRPGAYQGSPSAFMDPGQKDKFYPLDRIPVPAGSPALPQAPETVRFALTSYAQTLERLLAGYHILDRNYTYDFHNHLFLRKTPLLTNYRDVALEKIEDARHLAVESANRAALALGTLNPGDPFAALLMDLKGYVAYNFDREPVLQRLSGDFQRTQAGLQHAAHLYEGECKALGQGLAKLMAKHQQLLKSPATQSITAEFNSISIPITQAYAHHVVGF